MRTRITSKDADSTSRPDHEPVSPLQKNGGTVDRVAEARRRSELRRRIDPLTHKRQFTYDEFEFMYAMQQYKTLVDRIFPVWSELLHILFALGYEKAEATGQNRSDNTAGAEHEFVQAMEGYRQSTGRKFPLSHEVLNVLRSLGYRKTNRSGSESQQPDVSEEVRGSQPNTLSEQEMFDPRRFIAMSPQDLIEKLYSAGILVVSPEAGRDTGSVALPEDDKEPASLDAMLASLPKDATYAEQAQAARNITYEVRQRLAKQIAPALNAVIQENDRETLDEKKAICDFVNDELEPLGLAVQCPNTGLPGKLKATSGSWPGLGTFYFEVYVDGKQKKSAYSERLPTLVLMDAYPPKELGTVQEIVGTKSKRAAPPLP